MITIELPYPPSANRELVAITPVVWYNQVTTERNLPLRCYQHPGAWIPRKGLDTMLDNTTVFARCKYEESPIVLPESHGIYIVHNRKNGNFYIGSTVNLRQRWRQHLWSLDNNRHHNPHLQSAWNKYGANSFEFLVVEVVKATTDILPREQTWIDKFDASNSRSCYNFCQRAGSHLGRKRSDETKRKLSEAQKGKKTSEASKLKMRNAKLGKKLTPEHVEKLRSARTGKPINRPLGIINRSLRKFTDDDVRSIRAKKASGVSFSKLCKEYNSTIGPIQRIVNRTAYKDVK
jgi:group I intron endonuclease